MKLIGVLALLALVSADPVAPQIPQQFYMEFILTTSTDLPPFGDATGEMWIDASQQFTRTHVYFESLDVESLGDYGNKAFYVQQCAHPQGTDPFCACRVMKNGSPFPNLDLSGATYQRQETIDGVECAVWFLDSGVPGFNQEFYVDADNSLVRVTTESMSGNTQLDVISFQPGPVDPSVFDVATVTAPWNCQPVQEGEQVDVKALTAGKHVSNETEAILELSRNLNSRLLSQAHPVEWVIQMPHIVTFDWCSTCKTIVPTLMGVLCKRGGVAACALTALGAPVCAVIVTAVCAGGQAICSGLDCANRACKAARLC
jgi:hypothetical protein